MEILLRDDLVCHIVQLFFFIQHFQNIAINKLSITVVNKLIPGLSMLCLSLI